jgi:hemoglobin/transferrin/lactoferrin receptor protein
MLARSIEAAKSKEAEMKRGYGNGFVLSVVIGWAAAGGSCGTGLGQTVSPAETQLAAVPSSMTNVAPGRVALPEVVVTASRAPREIRSEPCAAYSLDVADATLHGAKRTTANTLDGLPSVMVQKTAYGQASPYLRGFTGYRTLCMVDGIRLNNSVFRSGPNQYWNTVDPLSLGRSEVVMGPGSVLYGSDAVGGVLNALAVDGPDWTGEASWEPRLYYRGASAERSNVGRIQLGGRPTEQVGFVGGYSAKAFGDLRGGGDVGVQKHTGYDEQDVDAKVNYYISDNAVVTLAHQTVRQEDAWRTHRTTYAIAWEGLAKGDDRVNSFDQARDLTYVRCRMENLDGVVNGIEATLSRHAQSEDNDRVKKDWSSERQGFDVETWGGTLQLESTSAWGQWVYGLDYYRDMVQSYARKYRADGTLQRTEIQGPVADDARYDLAGLFVSDTISCLDGGLDVIPGIRYTFAAADADKVKDPVTGKRTSFSDEWQATAASLRLLVPLSQDRRHALYGGAAQGFRAPNLSDLTRFDIARSSEIEIPAPDLDPETFITYEVGLKSEFERLVSRLGYYYTRIDGMIVRTPTGRVTDGLTEVTKMNSGDGYVQGLELSETCHFTPQWSAWVSATWQEGEADTYPSSSATEKQRDSLSRLMPPTAQAGVRYRTPSGQYWAEAVGDAAADADKLSAEDKLDTQRIPPGGTPGYAVCTLRAGARFRNRLDVTLALENVFDEDYRIHGSGVNEPGRNLVLTAASRF